MANIRFSSSRNKFLQCYKPKSVKEAEKQILSYGAKYIGEENFVKRYILEQRVAIDSLHKVGFLLYQDGFVLISILGTQLIPDDPSTYDYDKYFNNMPIKLDFPYYTIVQLPDNAGGY